MPEAAVLHLLDAATNVDIARYLNVDSFMDILHQLQNSGASFTNKATQLAARRLQARIQAWNIFEDSLSNTRGDFKEASLMLKNIGTEEQSIGIWLESMTLHDDLLTKLSENPVRLSPQLYPPCLLRTSPPAVSHDDFVSFVRGYIGVACVLAVLAWADSLGEVDCRERTLAVIHLWQGVDGYCEVKHIFLMLGRS